MNIGFDIDDTITNSSAVFIKYAKEYNIKKNISYSINTNELDQTLAFGWNDENKKEFRELYLERILTETIPNSHVLETINEIKNNGHRIYLITARNDNEIPNMYEFTKKWLNKNGIYFDELIVNCSDKLLACKEKQIEIFVDDNYITCKNISENSTIFVMMYSTNYNKNFKTNFMRVDNWNKILFIINKTEKEKSMKKELEYVDVDRREDFPQEPKGMRFVHFYGGTKNYRGYLAPADLSRADFMEQYPEYIPEQNIPVYENKGIILRADPKFKMYPMSRTK